MSGSGKGEGDSVVSRCHTSPSTVAAVARASVVSAAEYAMAVGGQIFVSQSKA